MAAAACLVTLFIVIWRFTVYTAHYNTMVDYGEQMKKEALEEVEKMMQSAKEKRNEMLMSQLMLNSGLGSHPSLQNINLLGLTGLNQNQKMIEPVDYSLDVPLDSYRD